MHQVWCITEFLSTKYPLKARKVWKATEWLEGMYTQQLRNATQNEHHKLTCAFHWSCHFWLPCKSLLTFVCCYVRKTWVHVQANPSPLYSLEWYGYIDLTPSYQTHLLALSNRNEVYIHFIQQPVITLFFPKHRILPNLEILPIYKVHTSREILSQSFSFFVPPKAHSPFQNSIVLRKIAGKSCLREPLLYLICSKTYKAIILLGKLGGQDFIIFLSDIHFTFAQ